MNTYVNYHRHDMYGNPITPDSVVFPEEYAKRAVELGHSVLSSVNHGWQGRTIEYYELAKKYNLKYLFGTEAYIVKNRFDKDRTNCHINILGINENGRKGINRILSEASISGFYYRPRIDMELLLSLSPNSVWITTACIAGLWKYDNADELILQVHNHFKDNFFLEVQYHNVQSQKNLNARILNLAVKNNIKIIMGCDSHYIYPEQAKNRDNFLLSKKIKYEDEEGWLLDYTDYDTCVSRFQQQGILSDLEIATAIDNTNIFLDVEEYRSDIFTKNIKLPTLYPEKSQEEKNTILSNLIWSNWNIEKTDVSQEKWEHYKEEISKELNTIISTNMADYFLLNYEIIKTGKENGGHITLTGRGSASSFYICKLLKFTTIDRISASIKLFPERFITKERILEAGSLPDIDFNLSNPEVFFKAQQEILGEDHSYPMIAYGTLSKKSCWKMYARAIDIDFDIANEISKAIDKYETTLKYSDNEDESVLIDQFIPNKYLEYYKESEKYLGIIDNFKIHPCGSILYNKNIKEEIGLIKTKEHICSCMDGLWAEDYKFIKNDLLKVSVVDLIYRVYERIGIEPHSLPKLIELCANNQKVWDIYKNAFVVGVNQVEQKSTSGRVATYAPKNISELAAFISSIRPGFQSNYKQFETREPFEYGVPSLDNLIQTNEFPFSFMLYQETSMQILSYAGIPISETYDILKNIAKKRVEKVLKYKEQFLNGMTSQLILKENTLLEESKRIASLTWQIIEDSSRYQFNASHAYSMAGDSLYSAYLKSYYPLEFYEVFLNLMEQDGNKDRMTNAKNEAERAYKIKFPPMRFGQDNRKIVAVSEKNEITSSLTSIKGFGKDIGNNMFDLTQIQHNNFVDLLVYTIDNNIFSSKFEDLIKINYFEKFGNNKKLLLFYKEFTKGKFRYNKKLKNKTKQLRLVELHNIFNNIENKRLNFNNQLDAEKEILGYLQSTYPVDKRFVYVFSIDTRFSPRIETYCLNNGTRASLKVQKKLYDNKIFYGGEILKIKSFKKKETVDFKDGEFIKRNDNTYDWWIEDYDIIPQKNFDEIVATMEI